MEVIGLGVAAVLVALAALHIYWALGGRLGASAAVPEVAGREAFSPGPGACVAVALLLLAAGALVAWRAHLVALPFPPVLATVGCGGVALVFAARAVGDFRLFGFCKRVRGTRFARLDDTLYSPLCLALAAGAAAVALGA